MNILLAPHNDDEVLFASYTCLRHKPKVIVVLRSFIEETWPGPTWREREAETQAATQILGCEYEQWTWPDSNPPWDEIRGQLARLQPDMVWAPLPEEDGHPHHNAVGEIARDLYPNVDFYSTYVRTGPTKTTTGTLVEPEPDWEALKRAAMGCYQTQANHPATHLPFDTWEIDEYIS